MSPTPEAVATLVKHYVYPHPDAIATAIPYVDPIVSQGDLQLIAVRSVGLAMGCVLFYISGLACMWLYALAIKIYKTIKG